MYHTNVCSPLLDIAAGSGFDFKIPRLLMVTVLFLLFIMYIVIRLVFLKAIKKLKEEDDSGGLL